MSRQDKRQTAERFEKESRVPIRFEYLLYLPREYQRSQNRWPLVMFLHGAGETGSDLNMVKYHGPPKMVEQGRDFPFVLVSPQSPVRGWDVRTLGALMDECVAKYKIDSNKLYITGLSMGGNGVWKFLAIHPGKAAAAIPICGWGDPNAAAKMKETPIWAFHGAKDDAVPADTSRTMVEAVQKAGGSAKLTVYPPAGHDSWTETYNNQEVWDWLLAQKKSGR